MAGNFLFPLSGTSFASPMLLRVMLSTSPAPFAPDSARAAILALRAPNGAVPFRAFPSDLIYDPNHVAATSALVATGAPVLTSVVVGRPRAPGARALARVLGPIRWTRRHRPAP
jgi:hypothetical protein